MFFNFESQKPLSGTWFVLTINPTGSLQLFARHKIQKVKNATTDMPLTFSDILLLTPRSINMLSHSVTPMAYRSLRTLAQAILPYKIEILILKHIKKGWCVK